MSERIKMTVTMEVTVPQALALQAMFKHWNRLASMGSSRMIGFYVDGDGNFKPKCEMTFSEPIPELTDELEQLAMVENDNHGIRNFDFDPVAWRLDHPDMVISKTTKDGVDEFLNTARDTARAADRGLRIGPDNTEAVIDINHVNTANGYKLDSISKEEVGTGKLSSKGVDGLTGGLPGLF